MGFEGCICKRADGIYIPDTTRKKDGWIKIKSNTEIHDDIVSEDEVYDTVDGFISGFNAGNDFIDALEVSAYVDGSVQVICWIDSLDDFTKSYVTSRVRNVVTLRPDILNAVVELDGTLKNIQRFRFDKTSRECVINGSLLKSIKKFFN